MLNRIVLMGRLTRDPELRKTQSDTPVCSFSLAVILATPSRKMAAMYPPMRENPAQGSARRPAALHRTLAKRMANCHSKKNGEGGQAALPPAHTHTKENKICQTVLSVRNL